MTRIVTPSSLKWLINKRARLLGQIEKTKNLTPVINTTQQLMDEAHSKYIEFKELHGYYLGLKEKLPLLKKQLKAIDIAFDMHDIKINKDYVQPIKPSFNIKSHTYKTRHGEITRSIFEYLRIKGRSASTGEIALFIIEKNSFDAPMAIVLPVFIDKVGSRLNALTAQGKIMRLHDPKIGKQGEWQLPPDDINFIRTL